MKTDNAGSSQERAQPSTDGRSGALGQPVSASRDVVFWQQRPSLAAPALLGERGRGLVALTLIEPGALIERACAVEITAGQSKPLDAMQPLGDFYFEHPDNPEAGLMAFGLMSLINHSDQANADVRWYRHDELGWIADLVAFEPITAGQEITYRYKCQLWFEAAG